jgi:hypothetical protein
VSARRRSVMSWSVPNEPHHLPGLADHALAAGQDRPHVAVGPDDAVYELEGRGVVAKPPEIGGDPVPVGRVDELGHGPGQGELDPRRQAEHPAELVGDGQLVRLQVPLPAPDLGDPLGLGQLAPAGLELPLGQPMVGDVPGQHHAADDRVPLAGEGDELHRPEPRRGEVAVGLEPADLSAQGGLAGGLGDGGVVRAADRRDLPAQELGGRPAAGLEGGAGRGPDLEPVVEGEDDDVGQVLGQEPEPGVAGRSPRRWFSGHVRPPPHFEQGRQETTTANRTRPRRSTRKPDSA